MSKRRIMISGASGFIGSHTVEWATKKKHEVFCIDNYSTGNIENIRAIPKKQQLKMTHPAKRDEKGEVLTAVDVLDNYEIDNAMRDFKPDAVIHLAAQPSLLTSMKDPIMDAMVNIYGTLNMLKYAEKHGVKRFVFASTSAVYADSCTFMNEHDAGKFEGPSSFYGLSKWTAEQYVESMFPNSICLRYGNVYGPRQHPLGENQLVPRAIRHMLYGDAFEIYGDGEQTRDYIYVKDVAQLNLMASLDDTTGAFNVSTQLSTSVNEILGMLAHLAEWEGDWVKGEAKDGREQVHMFNLRLRKAYPKMNFTPLAQGLEHTLNWWKKRKEAEPEKKTILTPDEYKQEVMGDGTND